MAVLENKIDFALVISVRNANPNGDPINGNRPRTTYEGLGEISDVCLKRKLRNRLLDEGESILVQSDDKRTDSCRSIEDRVNANEKLMAYVKSVKGKSDKDAYAQIACDSWYDVRAFGQVFAFGKSNEVDATSIGVRGPVTIQSAFSVECVDISALQITKSVNLKTDVKNPDKKGADTMGTKHRVDKAVYVTYGAINVQLAEKTGFSGEDADKLREALRTLFRNDASAARPEGSMEVLKLIWWEHNCKNGQYPSAKVHRCLHVSKEGEITIDPLDGLKCEVYDGE